MDIVRSVQVSVTRPTAVAGEDAITQVQIFIDRPASIARLAGRIELVNEHNVFAVLACNPLQLGQKVCKAQIRDFSPPKFEHALKVQIFKAQHVVLFDQFICKLPVVVLPGISNFAVDTRQIEPCSHAVVAVLFLARQIAVSLADFSPVLLEKQRRIVTCAIRHGEILLESKVKPCGLTRLERDDRLVLKLCRDTQPNIAYAVTNDRDRLNAFNIKVSMLEILEHTLDTPTYAILYGCRQEIRSPSV